MNMPTDSATPMTWYTSRRNRFSALNRNPSPIVKTSWIPKSSGNAISVYEKPSSRYVAELIGTNLFVGRWATLVSRGPEVKTPEGAVEVTGSSGEGTVFATVSPREITLYRDAPAGSAQNVFSGPVTEIAPEPPAGERVRVVLGTQPPLVSEVTEAAVASLGLTEGAVVYAAFKATGVRTYS